MNKIYVLPEDDMRDGVYRRIYLLIGRNIRAWPSVGAAFGLAGGMLSILLGLLVWVMVSFTATGSFGSFLNLLDTAFFLLPLPMLAIGAHCLDLLEKRGASLPLTAMSQPARFEHRLRLRPRAPHNN